MLYPIDFFLNRHCEERKRRGNPKKIATPDTSMWQ